MSIEVKMKKGANIDLHIFVKYHDDGEATLIIHHDNERHERTDSWEKMIKKFEEPGGHMGQWLTLKYDEDYMGYKDAAATSYEEKIEEDEDDGIDEVSYTYVTDADDEDTNSGDDENYSDEFEED